MPKKNPPGYFNNFQGLWARGTADECPPDHFTDCLNTIYTNSRVGTRDGTFSSYNTVYGNLTNFVKMALYKPNPPFSGINIPRIIGLKSNGELHDIFLQSTVGSLIYTNVLMKDFGFVNFFGRCYISPSDGKVGLSAVNVKVYDGTGAAGFRDAAGIAPTSAIVLGATGAGKLGVGTYLFSYALETASGFITIPYSPFVYLDSFGSYSVTLTIPVGPAGTVARWVIATQGITFRANLGIPFDVGLAPFIPQFFVARIGDNTTTAYVASFYDEQLVDSADYLATRKTTIPAGVGLLDYKGRMVSYGENADPSLVRISEIGEPESFSSTSGFLITDPADSTGVRCATEFRNLLYIFKRTRAYVTQDNQLEASTWELVNFDKSVGTEQHGVATVLDAKGSSSNGFIVASIGGLYYFNGTFVEPPLSYKILNLWDRINESYFHKIQIANDPVNKRIYCLVPLDSATEISHIIFGDYLEGLSPITIKWSLWKFANDPTAIVVYTDFTNNNPTSGARISNALDIDSLIIGVPGNDSGTAIDSYFELPPVSAGEGISQFTKIRIRGTGLGTITFTAYGEDKIVSVSPSSLVLPETPGREYAQLMNLVNEQCRLKIRCNVLNEKYNINKIIIENQLLWSEHPR